MSSSNIPTSSGSNADSVVLTIGDISFTYFESPQEINFGGKQSLSIHKMIGGQRFIDSMGVDDAPISWEGRFRGSNAVDRANALDYLRRTGQPVQLSWYSFKRLVVIEEFEPKFQQFYEVPYKITVQVLENQDATTPTQAESTSDALNQQLGDVQTQSDSVNDAGVSSAVSNISSLASNAGGLGKVAANTAANAVAEAQAAVQTAYNGQLNAITSGLSLIGNATQVATANIGVASNYLDAYTLSNMSNTLDNMQTNISDE